ncbi:MAG: DinB family protein [Cyclobacteriaceae bacterium]
MKSILSLLCVLIAFYSCAQTKQKPSPMTEVSDVNDSTYYYQIPDYPASYSAGAVAARMVDGLGFRFFHATADLTEENLNFKPSEDARTLGETMDHILGLTRTAINAVSLQPNDYSIEHPKLSFAEKRIKTLENIRRTSEILKSSSDQDLESYKVIFLSRDGSRSEFPFWNELNGPIADAIWHVGQIVSFRRSAGNPFNSKVSVLRGTVRE